MEKPFKNTEKNDETVEKMSEGTPRPQKKKIEKKKAKLILRPRFFPILPGPFVGAIEGLFLTLGIDAYGLCSTKGLGAEGPSFDLRENNF